MADTALLKYCNRCQPQYQVIKLKLLISATSDTAEIKVSVRESVGDGCELQMASSRYIVHTVTSLLVSLVDPRQY